MKRRLLFVLVMSFALIQINAQNINAYKLYTKKGKEVTFEKMIKGMSNYDIILLGELHNDPISHWMHLEIIKRLTAERTNVNVGFEMLETDDGALVNEYSRGLIREKDFLSQARLWPNYKTDYHPIVKFCTQKGFSVVATNVPRRYAALIARKGPEVLENMTPEAQSFLPPLPFPFDTAAPEYAAMIEMMPGHGEMTGENMAKAQALKDATMAWYLLREHSDGDLSFHVNGDYHSAEYGGIYRYIQEYNSNYNVATFSTVTGQNGEWNDEWEGRADFILVVTPTMTKTH